MKVAVPLVKNILAPLGITAAASAIISNKEMNDIMKIVRALEDSNILLKGVTKTIKIEAKEQKGGFMECYQVLQELVCKETYQQEKEL